MILIWSPFQQDDSSDDEFEWDDDDKLDYLINTCGFPDHSLVKSTLEKNNWNVKDAYYTLVEDLVENSQHYIQPEDVSKINHWHYVTLLIR